MPRLYRKHVPCTGNVAVKRALLVEFAVDRPLCGSLSRRGIRVALCYHTLLHELLEMRNPCIPARLMTLRHGKLTKETVTCHNRVCIAGLSQPSRLDCFNIQ